MKQEFLDSAMVVSDAEDVHVQSVLLRTPGVLALSREYAAVQMRALETSGRVDGRWLFPSPKGGGPDFWLVDVTGSATSISVR